MLPSCSNDLDELFCDPDCPRPDAGGEQLALSAASGALPALPFTPDEAAIPDCTDCVQGACEEQRESCLADEACVEVLRCMGPCTDPSCMMECWGQSFEAATPERGWSLFHELDDCAWKECPTACQGGQNWECAGKFDWPTADGNSIDAEVRFAPYGTGGDRKIGLAGARVRACPDGGCSILQSWQELDARNAAEFMLPTSERSNFQGYFELDSDEIGPLGTHYRIHYWPLWRDLDFYVGIVPDGVLFGYDWRPNPSAASLFVFMNDCLLGAPPSRLRLQLRESPGPVDVARDHLGDVIFETTESVGAAFFPEVAIDGEDSWFAVQAWFAPEGSDERLVAQREILLRAGFSTMLYLAPDTRTGE